LFELLVGGGVVGAFEFGGRVVEVVVVVVVVVVGDSILDLFTGPPLAFMVDSMLRLPFVLFFLWFPLLLLLL